MKDPNHVDPISSSPNHAITELINQWGAGRKEAFDRLAPLIYEEMRKIAHFRLRGESSGHTWQTTALVHELYLRLANREGLHFESRAKFFFFAGQVMRYLLAEHARGKNMQKRGGGAVAIPFQDFLQLENHHKVDLADVVALDEALSRLELQDQRMSRIVEMRFFLGMTHHEIGELMALSPTTVKREWRSARLWLFRELQTSE